MSTYASPLSPGKTSPKGFLRVLGKVFTGSGVIEPAALAVSAQLTPDMTVKVSGSALDDNAVLIHSDGTFIQAWNESDASVSIAANASGVTKTDAIVAYVDLADGSAETEDPANNPDSLKFTAVRRGGTDTGAPTSDEIEESDVGTNPYSVLAHVTVSNGASSINSGNISDQRTFAQVSKEYLEPIGTDQITQAFFKGRYQSDNANTIASSDKSGLTVQFGWVQIQGNGTNNIFENITFPTAFSTVLFYQAGLIANKSGTMSILLDGGAGFGGGAGFSISMHGSTGSIATINMSRNTGSFTVGVYYSASWIAIGIV